MSAVVSAAYAFRLSPIEGCRHQGRETETEHPAVFPVARPELLMQAHANLGDAVFEPFAASGTTTKATMAGLALDTAGALAAAREIGGAGWTATELLLAIRIGMAKGAITRREGDAHAPGAG